MPTVVSTGQITIVDQNDAKPITAFISASGPLQQIFTKDESTTSYTPNWATTALVLTPKVYVGSATEVVLSTLNNRKWSTDLSTSLGSTTTYSINANLAENAAPVTYYFEADYYEPTTAMSTHIIASITVSQVKTGTNAVYMQVIGQNVIENATGQVKNKVTLTANMIRAAGIDSTGVTYQWFQSPHGAGDQIDGNLAGVGSKYGFLDTAATAAGVVGAIGAYKTGAGGTSTAISTANVPDGGWSDLKSIVIDESAVQDIGVFVVKAKGSDGVEHQAYFTVYDISDPYDLRIMSSAGDKLQNGIGSTDLTPTVFYGGEPVTPLTGWTFNWTMYDRDGKRGAFIDTTRTAVATGRAISANTAGSTAAFTIDSNLTLVAGDIVKLVKPTGIAAFFEVSASTLTTVTIRVPTVNTWLAFPAPVLSEYVGGKLFVCRTTGTQGAANVLTTAASATLAVTGYDIDAKGTISCEAVRP